MILDEKKRESTEDDQLDKIATFLTDFQSGDKETAAFESEITDLLNIVDSCNENSHSSYWIRLFVPELSTAYVNAVHFQCLEQEIIFYLILEHQKASIAPTGFPRLNGIL